MSIPLQVFCSLIGARSEESRKVSFAVSLLSVFFFALVDRSLMAKKVDGIKESTDCNATIEDDDRGWFSFNFGISNAA